MKRINAPGNRTLTSGARAPLAICLLTAGLVSCLPEDDAAAPGTMRFAFRGDAESELPATVDGWTVRIDRAFLFVGRSYQDDPRCDVYSETFYPPSVVDLLEPAPADLGRVRGIGHCRSPLVAGGFLQTSRRGPSVDESDAAKLLDVQSRSSDFGGGMAIYLEATGRKDEREVRVSFALPGIYLLLSCGAAGTEGYDLRSGDDHTFTVRYPVASLFRDRFDASGLLRFEPIATADANGDGLVERRELQDVRLRGLYQGTGGYGELVAGSPDGPEFGPFDPSLFDWVASSVQRNVQVDGDLCIARPPGPNAE